MSAAINEAHLLGMKTTGDLFEWSYAAEVAVTMGIDALEHGIPTVFKNGAPGKYSYPVEETRVIALLQTMNIRHTAITSTISHLPASHPEQKATFRALTPLLQQQAREMLSFPNVAAPSVAPRRDYWCKSIVRFVSDGGLVMAGTDSFWLTSYPGDVHDELQELVTCGLSPVEALRAATLNPAQWLGLSDLGAINKGNRADLVILDANPLAAIENTRRIAGVVLGGHNFDRAALEALSELAAQPEPKR